MGWCVKVAAVLTITALTVFAFLGASDSAFAEGSVETNPENEVLNQLALEQYVGQTQTDMVTSDPPSLWDKYVSGTVGVYAGMFGGMHPQHDPDPGIAEETVEILTGEEVTSGPEAAAEAAEQVVLSALSEPVVYPEGIPDGRPNTGDTPYDGCDFATTPPTCG